MTQGIIAGMTDYSYQTVTQILGDINEWIKYAEEIKSKIQNNLANVQNSTIWLNAPFNFKMTVNSTVGYSCTIIEDLKIVKKAIESNCITKREVALLKKVGENASEYNRRYGLDYHENESWHCYGDSSFSIIEEIYGNGRDFFASLQDASNAASRLEDYMQTGNVMSVNVSGDVSGSQIQVGTINSSQNMENGSKEFPYEEVLTILSEISKYRENISEEFGENGGPFCNALDESIDETKKKGNPKKISKFVAIMKEVAAKVSTGLIVEGVKALIKQLPL